MQTSKPFLSSQSSSDPQSSLNSFHPYYNFHFANLDCVAYGSTCEAHNLQRFPTFVLFKNGELVKTLEGTKTIPELSAFVEDILESIKPGSRPKDGIKLPEVGDKSVNITEKPDIPAAKDKNAAGGKAAGTKHNEQVAQAAAAASGTKSAGEISGAKATQTTKKPSKPIRTPNPLGSSEPLTAELFQDKVTTTQDPWFIKFYAPWCHHCQAMAPIWAELGREMKGKLNIGEVNCDREVRLCKDVRLHGYPTILFFKGGERIEYDGLRGLGDFINFAEKAIDSGDGVRYVDAATFKELEKKEEVIFVYFYDHATTSEDFIALERLTLSLIGHAILVKTDSAILADKFKITTWPRLVVSREGRHTEYEALAPKDMRDFRKVLSWMRSVWLPLVPELTASNSREIMDGKLVVLGILSPARPSELAVAKREIKQAALDWMDKQEAALQLERQELRDAKQLRIEEAEDRGDQRALRSAKSMRVSMDDSDRREVGFAWVDGVFWERWIRTTYGIEVKDGERVVINDEDVGSFPLPYNSIHKNLTKV
jgi:protein disulfide-isomerase